LRTRIWYFLRRDNFLVGDYIENAGTIVLRNGVALRRIVLLKGKEGSFARREGVFGVEVSSSKKTIEPYVTNGVG
jgi:hypothetical protein